MTSSEQQGWAPTANESLGVQPRPIESASASTACQTSSSKFAYILTFGVLGLIAAFLIAIVLLFFTAVTTYNDYDAIELDSWSYDYEPHYYRYHEGNTIDL